MAARAAASCAAEDGASSEAVSTRTGANSTVGDDGALGASVVEREPVESCVTIGAEPAGADAAGAAVDGSGMVTVRWRCVAWARRSV